MSSIEGGHSAKPPKVELFDSLDAAAVAGAAALDRSSQTSLFARLSWFRLVAELAPPPGSPLIVRAETRKGECWLFLSVDGHRATALTNWYSLRFSAPGADPEGLTAMAHTLRRLRPAITMIELSPLGSADPLPAAFRKAGWLTFVEPVTVNWHIATDGMDFKQYWAGRPSRLRNTARRKAKAAALDIVIHDRFEPGAWAEYEEVYAASWKPEEGSPAFLRALAEAEGKAGALRLGIARKDGRPIAAQLWLVENGEATIHKLSYAENARGLSPGTILSLDMFRRVLDVDQVRRIDFGTGNDSYKADWMDEFVTLNRMTACNRGTLSGLARAGSVAASKLVRRA